MIPQHLVNKALDAWIGDHNCPHPDQIHVYRVLITRSLEAVSADIWDEGYEARQDEEASARVEYGTTFTDIIPNPYLASETA